MTELDILKHAQEYIEKMSKGINPLSDEPVQDGDVIKQENISRCLSYVSEYLADEIEMLSFEPYVPKHSGRKPFEISDEKRQLLVPFKRDAYLKEFVKYIKSVADDSEHYQFQAKWINDYFLHIGFLTMKGKFKVATKEGEQLGITSHLKVNDRIGEYYANKYTPNAQQFIIDNIDSIIEFAYEHNSQDEIPQKSSPNSPQNTGGKLFVNLAYPIQQSVEQFCKEQNDKCIIASTGSCVIESEYGEYSVVLIYNDRSKFISKDNIKTRSANYCILEGMLDAAKIIKNQTDVILLSSCPLGFNSKNSPNKELCNKILSELNGKGCAVYVASCNGRGEELNGLINSKKL